ncbi:MAG: NADH-quinone oxidoreductase subunit B family protein [Abditibacteriota bacterium]|nr:NADH-quinone oxidoreductase subunit B family protein [Abditibacteriota bacterium]
MGLFDKAAQKSPWIIHFDCNSCNGCDIEILACLTPLYDVERFGVINVGNPKHADILIVSGAVNQKNQRVLKNIYNEIPEPKAVIAIGACGCTGGIFRECYNVMGGIDTVIPVDVYVPGCSPKPEAIIDGVVKALGKLEEKRKKMKEKGEENPFLPEEFTSELVEIPSLTSETKEPVSVSHNPEEPK